VLPAGQHDSTERDHVHFADRVPDDRKGILSDLTVRGDVVRRVDVAVIDLISRNKLINLDGPRAFNLHSIKFFIFNDEVLSFSNLIAARNVLSRDNLAGFRVNVLLLQSVSGLPVNTIEIRRERSRTVRRGPALPDEPNLTSKAGPRWFRYDVTVNQQH
jgi:hypothetical protein